MKAANLYFLLKKIIHLCFCVQLLTKDFEEEGKEAFENLSENFELGIYDDKFAEAFEKRVDPSDVPVVFEIQGQLKDARLDQLRNELQVRI